MELLLISISQVALIAFLVWERRSERRDTAEVIAGLLQRIQAPEAAVVQHQMQHLPPSPMPIEYDNDDDFHKSREELAAMLANTD